MHHNTQCALVDKDLDKYTSTRMESTFKKNDIMEAIYQYQCPFSFLNSYDDQKLEMLEILALEYGMDQKIIDRNCLVTFNFM